MRKKLAKQKKNWRIWIDITSKKVHRWQIAIWKVFSRSSSLETCHKNRYHHIPEHSWLSNVNKSKVLVKMQRNWNPFAGRCGASTEAPSSATVERHVFQQSHSCNLSNKKCLNHDFREILVVSSLVHQHSQYSQSCRHINIHKLNKNSLINNLQFSAYLHSAAYSNIFGSFWCNCKRDCFIDLFFK